ncbi:hypothetical protein [Mycobacteroides sp. LB1]|uniref:hypothetical protein n=1 Tax=Mycobacteroides sp. LB1 TaxID=2750814 RepID=UPI001C5D2398
MSSQRSVRSRTGSISVVTTEQGLPVSLKIDQRELAKPPQALADEIFALCRLSAMRQQVARRREILQEPYGAEIVRVMELATEDELAVAEEAIMGSDDEPPLTWMRSV